jgi:hypothetical protein
MGNEGPPAGNQLPTAAHWGLAALLNKTPDEKK